MTVGLATQRLRYIIEAREEIALEQQPGSSLRGALFHALLQRFCAMPQQPSCANCALVANCPVAALVAPLRDEQPRGRDVPRPFVLRPPLRTAASPDGITVPAGDRFTFELLLFGDAIRLFPYVALSSQIMELNGLGRPLRVNAGQRGRFIVREIAALTGVEDAPQSIYTHGDRSVQPLPSVATPDQIAARAALLPSDRIALRFLTPTRLVADGKLVHTPTPSVLVSRLAERLDALEREYVPEFRDHVGSGRWRAVADSANLALAEWDGTWVEAQSFSTRQKRSLPMGGFVGHAVFAGELPLSLRELLAWGEIIHVGKNAVKGDGWFTIEG
jgi:CRISPR-associated endoribonuclease Cas6